MRGYREMCGIFCVGGWDPATDDANGPRIGPYEIRARAGAGGMGLVYRAWDRVLEREVALKVLHTDAEHTDRRERRLEQESKVMARLRHSNAVTVYDVGRSHGQRYVAMEYVEGTDLRKWIDHHSGSTSGSCGGREGAS